MIFEQHWPGGFRGKSFEIINIFSIQMYGAHTNAWGHKFDLVVKRLKANLGSSFDDDDDEFRFNDISTHEGHLRQKW